MFVPWCCCCGAAWKFVPLVKYWLNSQFNVSNEHIALSGVFLPFRANSQLRCYRICMNSAPIHSILIFLLCWTCCNVTSIKMVVPSSWVVALDCSRLVVRWFRVQSDSLEVVRHKIIRPTLYNRLSFHAISIRCSAGLIHSILGHIHCMLTTSMW